MRAEQRHKSMAREPEGPKQAINHKGGPSEIPRALQQGQQEEEQADLRQEDDRAPDTRDHAIGDEVTQCPLGQQRAKPGPDGPEPHVDPVHWIRGELEDHIEQPGHHHRERTHTQDRVGEGAIKAIGELVIVERFERRAGIEVDILRPAFDARLIGGCGSIGDARVVDRAEDLIDALARACRADDDLAAEHVAETVTVDADAPSSGGVDHVDRNDSREPPVDRLGDDRQIAHEVGRVDHDQQRVGGVGLLACGCGGAIEALSTDTRFAQVEAERVDARQIDQDRFDRGVVLAACDVRDTGFLGGAREVGGLGADARDAVEERGLADIGVAQHGDGAKSRNRAGRGGRAGHRVEARSVLGGDHDAGGDVFGQPDPTPAAAGPAERDDAGFAEPTHLN